MADAKHWILVAEEITAIAERMENPEAKRMMLAVAHDYLTQVKSAQLSAATSSYARRTDSVRALSSPLRSPSQPNPTAEVAVHST